MNEFNDMRLDLQLFAGEGGEGASASATGEGAATTVGTAADDGQQTLRALGVPEELLRKRAKNRTANRNRVTEIATQPQRSAEQDVIQQDAAANDTAQTEVSAQTRMTLAERMESEPGLKEEVNQYARNVVQKRIAEENSAKTALDNLTPLLQYLADSMGRDFDGLSVTELTQAVKDDFLSRESLRMGTSRETAEQLTEKRHENKRAELQRKAEEQRAQEERQAMFLRNHYDNLVQQGETLKQTFPSFDLQKEIENPLFVALTDPRMMQLGMTVEKAYRQIHQQELEAVQSKVISQKTMQQVTNAIRAGQNRPVENGTSGMAPSVTTFDYKNASRQQREAFKKQIFDAAARGEKIYPGNYGRS